MEIKTTDEICMDNVKTMGAEDVEWFDSSKINERWVAVDDINKKLDHEIGLVEHFRGKRSREEDLRLEGSLQALNLFKAELNSQSNENENERKKK